MLSNNGAPVDSRDHSPTACAHVFSHTHKRAHAGTKIVATWVYRIHLWWVKCFYNIKMAFCNNTLGMTVRKIH